MCSTQLHTRILRSILICVGLLLCFSKSLSLLEMYIFYADEVATYIYFSKPLRIVVDFGLLYSV